VRQDLVEHIDMAAIALAAAGLEIPQEMQAQNILAADFKPREYVFAARDRCDETIERIRSVRSDQYLYIRNFFPMRPHLQPNAYKDGKSIIQTLRQLHASHALDSLSERILFQPQRAPEELYDWKNDPWQLENLADKPDFQKQLVTMRQRLDRWIKETNDHGLESWAMYDSDMGEYLSKGNPQVEQNIALMKRWAAEGK
jgi:arylsulfatase A-like enzyme